MNSLEMHGVIDKLRSSFWWSHHSRANEGRKRQTVDLEDGERRRWVWKMEKADGGLIYTS